MKISAGLVIIQDNKILLGHPTGSPWFGTYSIPKGEIEDGENALKAAIRETREEIGIDMNIADLTDTKPGEILYIDNNGEVYKKVIYYVMELKEPYEHRIVIDKNKLQKNEIDWAGFLTKEEAEKRIFGRFKPLLKLLK